MSIFEAHLSTKRLLSLMIGALLLIVGLAPTATASGVTGWKAGDILDDYIMTNTKTMSVSQIQSFLNKRVPSCDTNGTQLSEYGGPDLNGDGKVQRWEWGKKYYNQTKFVCLRNYSQDGKTSAQIIYDASKQYSINPQVLLVLLQKEQGLVNDTWPLNVQYKSATGYGCPDTAPCDSDYYGLTNQINWAAKMYHAIMTDSPTWYTPYVLGNNYIQYNPDPDCGGSTVYIKNRATKALYNYTPYQPNKASLQAGWGTASCGAYGNRNFYLYFTSWFGTTHSANFVSLDTPRWMQLAKGAYKINLLNGAKTSIYVTAGTQLYFPDKANVSGDYYLRSAYDQDHDKSYGIPLSSIIDIPYKSLSDSQYFVLKSDASRVVPRTGAKVSGTYTKDSYVPFNNSIRVNGKTYYRTKQDTSQDVDAALTSSVLQDIPYEKMDTVRWLRISKATPKLSIPGLNPSGDTLPVGKDVFFDSKITYEGKVYLRSQYESEAGHDLVIPYEDLQEIPYVTNSTADTGWKTVASTTYKVDPVSGVRTAFKINDGQSFYTKEHIIVNGVTYYRTAYDTDHGIDGSAITAASVRTPQFVTLDTPRRIKMSTSAPVQDITTPNLATIRTLAAGSNPTIQTKILIDGVWYFRSDRQTSDGLVVGIRSTAFDY